MADVDFELRPDDPSSFKKKVWDSELLKPSQTSKYALVFSLANQNFAIAADFIEQIVELPAIIDVPSTGASLLGLSASAGQPVPVVDIAPLLGLKSPGLQSLRHGLLLNHKCMKVMLAIDSVVVLKELPDLSDSETPGTYQSCDFVSHACELPLADAFTASTSGDAQSSAPVDAKAVESGPADHAQAMSTARRVIVLEVPELMSAVQHATGQRPAS